MKFNRHHLFIISSLNDTFRELDDLTVAQHKALLELVKAGIILHKVIITSDTTYLGTIYKLSLYGCKLQKSLLSVLSLIQDNG